MWKPARAHLLDLLAQHNTIATFFIVGWVAQRQPELVRTILSAGHEIGCHSFDHRLVYDLTPSQFRADTMAGVRAIEDACGVSPKVYRAPSFSITRHACGRSMCSWSADSRMIPAYVPLFTIDMGFRVSAVLRSRSQQARDISSKFPSQA